MNTHEAMTCEDVTLHVVAAFTKCDAGGNLAGVVLDADALGEARMQAVATAAGFSETVFVSRSDRAGVRLDFFTPNRRIADCGHATVAAFSLLRDTGRVAPGETSKEIVGGTRAVHVTADKVFMAQREPRYESLVERTGAPLPKVLRALGLKPSQLDSSIDPLIADAGGPFLMIALREEADLVAATPDQSALLRLSEALDLTGFYLFVVDPVSGDADATTRMFAPRFGIPEESATGMAAGALGAVLRDILHRPATVLRIEQGRHMAPASPSLLEVRLGLSGAGHVREITTGGQAKLCAVRCVPSARGR